MTNNNFLQKFKADDLILIAMLTAITIAVKAVVGILIRLLTGSVGIPGGALAGGFYMLWMALGIALIRKRGVAFLISLVQAIVLIITNTPGSHGIWTFFTYLAPSIAIEAVFLINYRKECNVLHFIFSVMIANIIGTFGSNLLFFRMSFIPLMFTLTAAAFSGAIGGVLGFITYKKVLETGLFKKKNSTDSEETDEV